MEMDPSCKRIADHIATVSNCRNFHYCHHAASTPLVVAINVETRFLDACTDLLEQSEIIQKLKLCVSAMKVLAAKYKLINLKYGLVIMNTENIIQAHQDHMQLMDMYSSLAKKNAVPPMQFNAEPTSPQNLMPNLHTPPTSNSADEKAAVMPADELESLLNEFLTEDDLKPLGNSDPVLNELFL
jgi:hypothetical protein